MGLASRRGGENYGWNIMEGSQCYSPRAAATAPGSTLPVYEYTHAEGCSVTGGVVYRGCRMPDLAGTYFFGDFCTRARALVPPRERPGDRRARLDGEPAGRQLARVLRTRRRRRGLRRGLRRRGVPPRAGELSARGGSRSQSRLPCPRTAGPRLTTASQEALRHADPLAPAGLAALLAAAAPVGSNPLSPLGPAPTAASRRSTGSRSSSFEPALEAGMAEQLAAIDKITAETAPAHVREHDRGDGALRPRAQAGVERLRCVELRR